MINICDRHTIFHSLAEFKGLSYLDNHGTRGRKLGASVDNTVRGASTKQECSQTRAETKAMGGIKGFSEGVEESKIKGEEGEDETSWATTKEAKIDGGRSRRKRHQSCC